MTNIFHEIPIYWFGIASWSTGALIYCIALANDGNRQARRVGLLLTIIGFLVTGGAHFLGPDINHLRPGSGSLRELPGTMHVDEMVVVAWSLGGVLIVLGWAGLLSGSTAWSGFLLAMAATIASWIDAASIRWSIIAAGVVAGVTVYLMGRHRTPRPARGWLGKLTGRWEPWDHEKELVKVCHGSKRMARRLIEGEKRRSPGLSDQGAALAALARLRRDRA